MFGKKPQPKDETKQYSISQEEVHEIAQLAQGQWLVQKLFKYTIAGFNQEIGSMQKNIVARLAIDEDKVIVDWSTLFKDSKIFTHPKPKPVEEVKKDAEPELPKGSESGKKD